MSRSSHFLSRTIAVGGTAYGAYELLVRPRMHRWGATDQETYRPLAGDDLIPRPMQQSTRAITVHAPAGTVWPWLVQLGQGRGGFYSYEWLQNRFGLDMHNAERIVPELQELHEGETISLAPDEGLPMLVARLVPNEALVLRTGDELFGPVDPGNFFRAEIAASWAFVLVPTSEEECRLIVRWRSCWRPGGFATLASRLALEPVHFVMERKMMLGIRSRAEESFARDLIDQFVLAA